MSERDRNPPPPGLASLLRDARLGNNLSQSELAKRSGVAFWTIVKIEQGTRGVGRDTLTRLTPILGQAWADATMGILVANLGGEIW